MKIALVHDWVTGMRGGERVLHELAAVFPGSDLYTLVHRPGATSDRIDAMRVVESGIARLPGGRRHFRKLLPVLPWFVERFRFEGYDAVLSSSHAVAKGVLAPPGTPHVCYCHTPMRYVWDHCEAYLGRGVRRTLADPLVRWLRRWDRGSSGPDRVTRFVANSRTVAERVHRHYGREARVVYPPVDLEAFRPDGGAPEDYYLMVSSFVPYKREELAVEAFRNLDRPLLIAGDGPRRERVRSGSPPNVVFLGRIPDAALAALYARCRAFVHPQEEDLGIAALEAQASGRPVIAFGRGGATETVVPIGDPSGAPATGVFFREQTVRALEAAVREFEQAEARFDPRAIRAHAERFGASRFRREIREIVEQAVADRR